MAIRILIIEDEKPIQNILKAFLEDAGYAVLLADDGAAGIEAFRRENPELVLLDILLPRIDGYGVCAQIRAESSTPIILLTALDDIDSQLRGFDLQADDYITKPFSIPLVMRRIEAVLRRTGGSAENKLLTHLKIRLNPDSHEVFVADQEVMLTAREFEILQLFLENPSRVFTREQLLDRLWNYDFLGDDRIINTHIKNIRKKLGVPCIETVRGVGYRLDRKNQTQPLA